jgi:tetratricopeptide (TPR) repeat protein
VKVPKPDPPAWHSWLWGAVVVGAVGAVLGLWASRGLTATDPDRVWREAEDDFMARRYDRAEAALGRLARLRKPTGVDRMLAAQVAMVRDRNDQALDELARIPDGDPMVAQARLLAGQLELRRRRMRSAEALLREAVRLDPSLVQAHKELVYIYGMLLRRRELHGEFRALAELTPLTFDNVFHWCLTRNSIWEPKEITDDLRAYVEADPSDRWSRIALAENLRQVGQRDEAEQVLDALPASDPEARIVRVRLALDRNDEVAASTLLADAPADYPELARMAGRLALSRRDGATSLKYFRAALAAEPDHRDGVFGMGQALAMTGDKEGAARYLAAARDLDALGTLVQRAAVPANRNDPELVRSLGAACEKAHRFPEARAWYSLLIRANPLDADAQKALFRLKDRQSSQARG